MTMVFTGASMSLDGYIAGPNETGFEHLFKWYGNGDVSVPTADPNMTFQMTEVSANHYRSIIEATGALVVGRRLFDFTGAWGGTHPMNRPVVVLTHNVPDGWQREGSNFTFVTDGIVAAVDKAKELAEGKAVGVNGGRVASQCINAGLLDEIWVDLVPVLLGAGVSFFDQLQKAPVELDGPEVTEDTDVTHLRYRVRRT